VEQGYLDKASCRQHLSCELPESGRFNEVDFNVVLDPVDSSFSGFEELDSVCRSYKRRAECLSRLSVQSLPVPVEWPLDSQSFHWVISLGSAPQVDLMATSLNHHLPMYVFLFLDPQSVPVDAISLDWDRWDSVYLFLPVKALPLVMSHLQHFKGRVTLIAPWWPTQSWFSSLLGWCSNPREFSRAVLSELEQG